MKIKSLAELVKNNCANDIEIEINVTAWLKENDPKNFAKYEKIREEIDEFWAETEEDYIHDNYVADPEYLEKQRELSLLDNARNLNKYFQYFNKVGIKFTEMKKDFSDTGAISFKEIVKPEYYDFVEYYKNNWTISGPNAEEMFTEFYKLAEAENNTPEIIEAEVDYITDCRAQENTQNDTKTENDTTNDTSKNTHNDTQNYPKIKNIRNFRADIRSARAPPDI